MKNLMDSYNFRTTHNITRVRQQIDVITSSEAPETATDIRTRGKWNKENIDRNCNFTVGFSDDYLQ